ncbi:hypothetical protein Nepgr_011588 [Nepenthes gracilis]|uniref:Uncharacterized protein n=1 Tax=Nepenthes gracilis TaxID=150966 RepID=A0AAD3XM36_NEPGR|nr:hypothetical protein Nepgr_011588 [Nepenthes gracilis]
MNYFSSSVDYDSNVDIADDELPLHAVKAGVKQLARALVVTYTPGSWQSICGGSGSMRDHSELPRVLVSSDCLPLNDNSASALITEENLVDTVGIIGSKRFGTEFPSPLPADGLSPSSEGGGPKSSLKKSKRCKKKRSLSSIPPV